MQNINLRFVNEKDTASLIEIYKPYVLHTAVTFEYDVPSEEKFADRIKNIIRQFPYLVCEIDGKIAGYAYCTAFKERAAYQWDIETSVYINEQYHHNKIASAFYWAILEFAKLQGYFTAYAIITIPNEKSIGFHKSMGYVPVGIFKETGYKMGKWRDVMWLEKIICQKPNDPQPPLSINDISIDLKNSILNQAKKFIIL